MTISKSGQPHKVGFGVVWEGGSGGGDRGGPSGKAKNALLLDCYHCSFVYRLFQSFLDDCFSLIYYRLLNHCWIMLCNFQIGRGFIGRRVKDSGVIFDHPKMVEDSRYHRLEFLRCSPFKIGSI